MRKPPRPRTTYVFNHAVYEDAVKAEPRAQMRRDKQALLTALSTVLSNEDMHLRTGDAVHIANRLILVQPVPHRDYSPAATRLRKQFSDTAPLHAVLKRLSSEYSKVHPGKKRGLKPGQKKRPKAPKPS